MPGSIGIIEAQRILKGRQEDAQKIAWQLRKGEILRSQAPVFFAKLAQTLQESADEFNRAMALEGENALSVRYCEQPPVINVEKRYSFNRQIVHYDQDAKVKVITVSMKNLEKKVTENVMLFDVSLDGNVELSGQNFIECAASLFTEAADAFR